jgi:putative ABC transport system permease protein
LGLALQRFLVTGLLSDVHMKWQLPLTQIIIIIAVVLLITLVSVAGPLKKVKANGIFENIGALQ